MKITSTCMKFFGKRKDETLAEFVAEVKALTPEDKVELKPLLEKELGITVEPDDPTPAPKAE